MSLPHVKIKWRTGVNTRRILRGVYEATVLKWDDGNGFVVLWTPNQEAVKVKKNEVILERLDQK